MSAGTGTVQETTLPGTGAWEADEAHTSLEFVARHLMVTKVRGRFRDFSARVDIAERLEDSKIEARIAAASIDTNAEQRDGHLRSPDFFDVANHPEITFSSTKIELAGESKWRVTGDFTIKDVTRPLALDVEYLGSRTGPAGPVAFFSARGELDREDFGMTWNAAVEGGGWLVSKKVQIEIEVELVRSQEA